MHLTLPPQQGLPGQPEMTIHVAGDILTIDGTAHDLSVVPEGGEGWPEGDSPFLGPITRQGGVIHCTLVTRLGDDAAPDQGGPWVIGDADGAVAIPALRKAEAEQAEPEQEIAE
ncbi:MAG: hypothetical protein JJU07_06170 [Natronohydrobacter sp.]|nr:hypothetical protein [Natronohydrobacter sp.]